MSDAIRTFPKLAGLLDVSGPFANGEAPVWEDASGGFVASPVGGGGGGVILSPTQVAYAASDGSLTGSGGILYDPSLEMLTLSGAAPKLKLSTSSSSEGTILWDDQYQRLQFLPTPQSQPYFTVGTGDQIGTGEKQVLFQIQCEAKAGAGAILYHYAHNQVQDFYIQSGGVDVAGGGGNIVFRPDKINVVSVGPPGSGYTLRVYPNQPTDVAQRTDAATSQTADLHQYRDAAGATLSAVDAQGVPVLPTYATASRPAASRPGRVIFDTDLSRPIYDTGTGWVNADGTAA